MVLDATAVKSLELFENIHDNTSKATLFALMNETVTPMGGRLLRHWMSNPLSKLDQSIDDYQQSNYLQKSHYFNTNSFDT